MVADYFEHRIPCPESALNGEVFFNSMDTINFTRESLHSKSVSNLRSPAHTLADIYEI